MYVVDAHPLEPDVCPYAGRPHTNNYSKYHQPTTFTERVDNANKVTVAGVFDEVLVDWLAPRNTTGGNNPVWCNWGPAPNPGWLISKGSGSVKLGQEWLDCDEMDKHM